MKPYKPNAEDIAMLQTTNSSKIRRLRNSIELLKISIRDAFMSDVRFIRRWFRENFIEVICGILMTASCVGIALFAIEQMGK